MDIFKDTDERTSLGEIVLPTGDTDIDNTIEQLDSLTEEELQAVYMDMNIITDTDEEKMIFPAFVNDVLGQPLYDCHLRLYLFQEMNPFSITHAPIDHWKTTLSVYVILYNFYRNSLHTVFYLSAAKPLASRVLIFVKREVEENKKLNSCGVRKPIKPEFWSKTTMEIERPYRTNWPPSLVAHGIGDNFFGIKANHLIGDDICNLKNSKSETRREELKMKFLREAMSRLTGDGQKAWLLGSVIDKDDLLCTLSDTAEDDEVRWEYLRLQAVIDDETQEVLFPERHPYKSLKSIELESPILFRMGYQNERISYDENAIVKRDVIVKCFDTNRSYRQTPSGKIDRIIVSVDLSVIDDRKKAEETDSSYFCAGTWFLQEKENRTYNRYLVDMIHDRGIKEEDKLDAVYNLWAIYHPDIIIVESNQYQATFMRHLVLRGVPEHVIHGHTTGSDKLDPLKGIPAMTLFFEREEYSFPYKNEEDRVLTEILANEFTGYGYATHNDCVMMTWLCEKGIETGSAHRIQNVKWSFGRIRRTS